jgi:hypothetical protein
VIDLAGPACRQCVPPTRVSGYGRRATYTRSNLQRVVYMPAELKNRSRSIQDGRQGAGPVARRTCDRNP